MHRGSQRGMGRYPCSRRRGRRFSHRVRDIPLHPPARDQELGYGILVYSKRGNSRVPGASTHPRIGDGGYVPPVISTWLMAGAGSKRAHVTLAGPGPPPLKRQPQNKANLKARLCSCTHPLRMTSGTPCGPVGAAIDGPAPPALVDPKLAGCSGGKVRLNSILSGGCVSVLFLK